MMNFILWYALLLASSDKNYLLGRFEPSEDRRFVAVDSSHWKGDAGVCYLRKETLRAFLKMKKKAGKDGVNLFIVSAVRNFEQQKRIWENKWNGKTLVNGKNLSEEKDLPLRAKAILLYSSMPGTSRHHWGTDMDLNNLENEYFEKGEGLKIYEWLCENAPSFGFCQPYDSKQNGRKGYEEEKWHWSYLPLSSDLLKEYKKKISYADISDFEGSEMAEALNVIDDYVEGVACKEE